MQRTVPDVVADRSGATRRVLDATGEDLVVEAPGGARVHVAADALDWRDGVATLDGLWGELGLVIPVVAEAVDVTRRTVERGRVRVRKVVREEDVVVDEALRADEIEVEVVPVGRYVDRAPGVRREGDLVVVPCVEEVLVIEKRLRLVEEVHIRTRRVERREPLRVRVRREEISVEREPEE